MSASVWTGNGCPGSVSRRRAGFGEELTVILGFGSVRGWRDALLGTDAAFLVLSVAR